METRNGSQLLLFIGVVGLLLTMLASVYWGGSSAHKIQGKVEAEAARAVSEAGHEWASVRAIGQRVVVSGLAPSEAARRTAITAAEGALGVGGLLFGGVTKVSDEVEVAPLSSSFSWKASVDGETLVLTGDVPTRMAEDAILDAAASAFPSLEIQNYMSLASGAPDGGDWTEAALLGLRQLTALDTGAAELTNTSLTVRGVAVNSEAPAAIDAELRELAEPYTARSLVTGLYGWVAEIEAGRLVLAGQAPDAASRRGLVDVARRFFDGDVEDRMTIGGSAEWTVAARLALPHFTQFMSGRMSVAKRTLYIEGRATESVYDYLREDLGRMSSGFGVQYDVDAVAPIVEEIADIDLSVGGEAKSTACQQAFAAIMANNRIYFATNQATITRRSGQTLDKLVAVARQCSGLKIEVSGHTDDRGPRGYNIALSQRRAGAVAAYLTNKGLAADQILAVGYGPDRPAMDNTTPENRAANRRIEFIVLAEGEL